MAVNLKKNKTELEQAWQEIRDPKSKNDWVVFGYDGKTYDLKVVGKGDEGLEEMVDEFSSGKIMYGGCRVIDPNTELPKMVFVNWQGEGVPTNVKGVCANHLRDITGFFRGAHVTVNARCEDDLDPDAVKDKVKKSSGANFSYHKEKPRPEPANKPVKSVYQRIIPEAEIDIKTRDKFWSQQEKDEQQRVKEETARQAKEREEMEKKRRERETQEAKKREAFIRERSRSIEEQRALHKKELQRKKDDEKQRYQETMKEMQRDDEEFRHRSDSLRKQRLQEVGKLIKARKESFDEGSPREVFDKPAHKKPPPPVAAKKKKQPPPPVAKKTPRQENESIRKPPVALPVTRNEPKPEPEPEPFAKPKPLPEPVARYEPEPEPEPEPQPQIQEPESVFPHREPEPKIPPRVHEPEPPRRELTPEPEMPEEENLYDTIEDEPSPAPAAPPVPVHSQEPESVYEPEPSFEPQPSYQPEPATHVQQEQYEEDNLYETVEDTIPEEPPQEPAEPVQQDHYYSTLEGDQSQVEAQITPLASQGIIARAIYDYQAEDEGEITFDPGDIITNIDTFDEGWWKGQAPDGRYGMFPANYVEIIESDQDSLFDVDVSFSTKESIHWGGLFIMVIRRVGDVPVFYSDFACVVNYYDG